MRWFVLFKSHNRKSHDIYVHYKCIKTKIWKTHKSSCFWEGDYSMRCGVKRNFSCIMEMFSARIYVCDIRQNGRDQGLWGKIRFFKFQLQYVVTEVNHLISLSGSFFTSNRGKIIVPPSQSCYKNKTAIYTYINIYLNSENISYKTKQRLHNRGRSGQPGHDPRGMNFWSPEPASPWKRSLRSWGQGGTGDGGRPGWLLLLSYKEASFFSRSLELSMLN